MDPFPLTPISPYEVFPVLEHIPQPPKELFMRGSVSVSGYKILAVVGSRNCTSYGKAVCRSLIKGLRGFPIIIVSGLALGIDREAHEAAIDAGLITIAFPGSSLEYECIYPRRHLDLAKKILSCGGALVSEYKSNMSGFPWIFPRRNRLIAGVCDMTLVIESEECSGTRITAQLATDYNKTVGAVPGPITSRTSTGTHALLKLGAVVITESADILRELNL
jgi:DNA processing protein